MNIKHIHIPEIIVPGKTLGRHIHHDERSRAFETPHQTIVTMFWPRKCDPFDQGSLGSCTGNAMIGAVMTMPIWKGQQLIESDCVNLYSEATKLDNIYGSYPPDDTGSSGIAVAKAAKRDGIIKGYHHAFSLQKSLAALSKGPVIIGINWYEGFDRANENGLIEIDGSIRGGHEVVLDGIDVENGLVWGTNSWGLGYGLKGRFNMTFGTLKRLLKQNGDCTIPFV